MKTVFPFNNFTVREISFSSYGSLGGSATTGLSALGKESAGLLKSTAALHEGHFLDDLSLE